MKNKIIKKFTVVQTILDSNIKVGSGVEYEDGNINAFIKVSPEYKGNRVQLKLFSHGKDQKTKNSKSE